MKFYFLPIAVLFATTVAAQNVGINNSTPETRLHIKGTLDTTLLTLESPIALDVNKNVGMLFKNGTYYTGGIRTIGSSVSTARLGFYTMSPGFGANEMKESMSISNEGNVGIGYIAPVYKLAVNGTGYFYNDGSGLLPDVAAVKGYSVVNSRFSPGVIGTGISIGVLGNANTINGIGIVGYNNVANASINYFSGAGIQGFSSGGHGVAGSTTKIASAGVYGTAALSGAWGGRFVGSGGALALSTSGPISLVGIGEGAGKVLTSDANGNATWQTPSGVGTTTPIAFSAFLNGPTPATGGNTYTLSNLATEYQYGSSFNAGEGLFIAPADGVYQFTVRIDFRVTGTNPIYSVVGFKVNGNIITGGEFNQTTPATNNSWDQSLTYTKTMSLSVGANVQVIYKLTQAGTTTFTIGGDANTTTSFFSGIKLL
jgi:hypothetical protein